MTSKMGDDDDKAQKHIENLRRIVGKLKSLNIKVEDEQYKIALLRILPRSYESLVVTL